MSWVLVKVGLLLCLMAAVLAAAGAAQAGTFDLTVVTSSGGSVTTPATGSFPTGTAVPLTATTTSFASWQLLNGSGTNVTATYVTNPTSPTAATLNNSVPADNYTLIANYGHFITVAANLSAGYISGTVLPASGSIYLPGQQVTLSATTNATHGFGNWKITPTGASSTDLSETLLAVGDVTNPQPHASLNGSGYSFTMPDYDLTITYSMSAAGVKLNETYTKMTYNLAKSNYFAPTQSINVIIAPVIGTGFRFTSAWHTTGSGASMTFPVNKVAPQYNVCSMAAVIPTTSGYSDTVEAIPGGADGNTSFFACPVTISPTQAGTVLLTQGALNFNYNSYGGVLLVPVPVPGYSVSATAFTLSNPATGVSLYNSVLSTSGYPASIGLLNSTWGNTGSGATLTANFVQITYPAIALATNPAGLTLPTSTLAGTCHYGDTSTLTAAANSGYAFTGWTVSGGTIANTSANLSQAVLTVQGSASVVANYVVTNNYTVTLNVGPQGTAVVTPSQANYTYGQQVTVTMSTITAGNVLDHWVLNGTGVLTNSGALTATLAVQGTDTISAVYTSGSYVNNLSPGASDTGNGALATPFKTINHALSKVHANLAQSIVIQQGIYREAPSATVTGAPGNPITLRSNPGDRVVVTGASVIPQGSNSWTLCTSTTASGNPNYANIYYTDVNWSGCIYSWAPFRFSEDEQPLLEAQTPSNGLPCYWTITGTEGTGTLIDTNNLTQADSSYWLGSSIFYVGLGFSEYGNAYSTFLTVTSYDPATSKLTFTPTQMALIPNSIYSYFLYGSPKLIGGPGQWAIEALSTSNSYRIWVWPTNGGRPDGHVYQASYLGGTSQYGLLNIQYFMGSPGYYIIDGLELCNSTGNGVNVAGSNSGTILTSGGNHIVRNCVSHDNDYSGIQGWYNLNGQYIHNLTVKNGLCNNHQNGGEGGSGFTTVGWLTTPMNETWQENEISHNICDGFYLGTCSLNIVGNYIHHNGQYGHSDGIQLCTSYGSSSILLNNLWNANGDMIQGGGGQTVGVLGRNNVGLNTLGWGFQSAVAGMIWDHNTFVGLGCLDQYSDAPLTVTSNLLAHGMSVGSEWYADASKPYYSDSNMIYWAPGLSVSNTQMPTNSGWLSWKNYLIDSGMDSHTITDSLPLMNAAPAFYIHSAGPDPGPNGPGYTTSTVYLYTDGSNRGIYNTFTGDHIELNGDGVDRVVTNVDLTNSIVTFTPSWPAKLLNIYGIMVANWKTQTCTSKGMDVMLQATSPAKGMGGGGTDIGALNFKVADYMAGKLNGASKRVLPIWPPVPVNLASTGWKYKNGSTAYSLTEGSTYTNPNMTGFQLTVSAPLYALSCTNSAAVTVVDNTGTTYPINAATLDSTGTVLTIVMTNGALPRNVSWIQVNVGPKLMGANGTDPTVGTNGGPVLGVKSMRFTIN